MTLRWAFAGLLVILCLSKVLSPQFLIWLLPLAASFGGRDGQRLFRACFALMALTHLFFPALYGPAHQAQPLALSVLLARNLGLVCWPASRSGRAGRTRSPHGCGAGGAPAVNQVSMVVFCSGVSGPVGLPARGMKSASMAFFITW